MESLAYSLSHDLRSPLRAMEGFSSVLLRDHGDRLDDSGLHALTRIQAAARRMGEVISGLQELSRISRVSMSASDVNLSAIARHLAASLQEKEPDRSCVFAIEEGLSVRGDARLLELMLAELIENAWKFTSGCASASIRFWRSIEGESPTFHISDNGAGFDMEYKDKLFRQFERLHGEKEFPGTGLGLVIAHRIVMRHRGRIRAESVPGRGATFSFTLGDL
jgi:signal transduction histidine kinase